MALILLAALFGFQFLILYWKSKHYRSFQAVTLVGLWLVNNDFSLARLLDNYLIDLPN